MAKKFILIDQSIASIAGHHYEYAVHVLEAAQRAGYEPYLATNTRFARSHQAAPWKTFPIYRYSFWATQGQAQFSLVNWTLGQLGWLRFRWRLFYRYSLVGLLWAVRDRFGEFLLKQPLDRAHLASLATLIPAALLVKLIRWTGLLFLLPVMLLVFLGRSTARLLKAGGFPENYIKSLLADPADAWSFVREVWARRASYLTWWQQYRSLKAFSRDTERLLREIPTAQGDIVFIPTLGGVELMGLARTLQARKPGPSWHVLFRRDIYPGRESGYSTEEWRVHGLRNSLLGSAGKWEGHDVRFYTDTDELTTQYNRLGVVPFQTLPIPHTHRPIAEEQQKERPLRCIYIGDARREKGYHDLPRLVEDLWTEHVAAGKISFHLQSNFNVPQGEPEAVIAREQLEQLALRKPGAIELIKQPLTSEQYKVLLLSGDINLLLYDATSYYARSSGILVESLTAGVPVIVPAGSWLARQFLPAVNTWQLGLRERMSVLKSHHLGGLRWQTHGTGRADMLASGELRASRESKTFTWLRVPAGATHLLVELVYTGVKEGVLFAEQLDSRGNSVVGTSARLVESEASGRAVDLIELDSRCVKLWFAVGSAPPAESVAIRSATLEFLTGERQPRSTVGVVYQDRVELPSLMRELVEYHDHYRKTAREFARNWRDYHNAGRLVEMMEAPR